ncbi:MAG TPA: pyridoxal phosphate-dependent aminotransferase [Chloroflexota bacterium]|nr:pyridoxal phosphate-dependent aminotransferase [Chloroflexota bacterium]
MVTGQKLSVSTRARDAIPSPMRKLSPLAEAAVASGVRIYHLNIGQPDIHAPATVLETVRDYDSLLLPYAPSQGLPETLDAWRAYYAGIGLTFDRSELLVTVGGSEAILFALMAVADPGDEAIVFEPGYANYFGFAHMASVGIVPIPSDPATGYRLPPTETIEAGITARTRAIVVTNPGNPTGAVYSYEELGRIVEIARRHELFVISDETYREIVFDGPRDMSVMKVPGAAERAILVDSLSKRFSATGARIGCLASHNTDVMSGVLRFAQARLAVATVEQLAMIPILLQPDEYTEALTRTYRRRRDVVYGRLSQMPGVRVTEPEGAFYILATLPIDDSERFARWLLTDFRSNGETVMVAPGEGFYLTPEMGTHEVRLAFVLEEAALDRAMTLLQEALRAYPGAESDN